MSAGKSETVSEQLANAATCKFPLVSAVKAWQDVEAEIKLKKAMETLMTVQKIPSVIVRSVNLRSISALKELGLMSGDAEIDLITAYTTGDFIHVVILEVKRADTYPWKQNVSLILNKQAVNSAGKQLKKDLDLLQALLAGVPPSQVLFTALACFPDASSSELQTVICSSCLDSAVVCQDDLFDMDLLKGRSNYQTMLIRPQPVEKSISLSSLQDASHITHSSMWATVI